MQSQPKQGSADTDFDRRPKVLRYEQHAMAFEKMIIDALPEVVAKLVSMAKEGNVAAARYLIDRIHGRPAKLASAAVADTGLRYTHMDWTTEVMRQKERHDAFWSPRMPPEQPKQARPRKGAIPGIGHVTVEPWHR